MKTWELKKCLHLIAVEEMSKPLFPDLSAIMELSDIVWELLTCRKV